VLRSALLNQSPDLFSSHRQFQSVNHSSLLSTDDDDGIVDADDQRAESVIAADADVADSAISRQDCVR
jgi:hypothetical protein